MSILILENYALKLTNKMTLVKNYILFKAVTIKASRLDFVYLNFSTKY